MKETMQRPSQIRGNSRAIPEQFRSDSIQTLSATLGTTSQRNKQTAAAIQSNVQLNLQCQQLPSAIIHTIAMNLIASPSARHSGPIIIICCPASIHHDEQPSRIQRRPASIARFSVTGFQRSRTGLLSSHQQLHLIYIKSVTKSPREKERSSLRLLPLS